MKEKTSAGAARKLSKKLHRNDILRKFAFGMTVIRDGRRTLRTMISVTLPFDSRKSRKFTENLAAPGNLKTKFSLRALAGFLKRISQWIASDAHILYYKAWAAPAVLLIRVVREPTWAKYRRVCPRLLFLLIAIMPVAAVSQNSRQAESTIYKLKNSKTNTMPQIIKVGGGLFSSGELIRINPSNNSIESSGNGGRSWIPRCTNTSYGTFRDLLPVSREILAVTSRGLYVSTNSGRSFSPRCVNSSYGEFINLQNEGNTLLANTTKGLYYSTNGGRSWVRR